MQHHPHARLRKSRWGKVTVFGPRLNVAAQNTEIQSTKLRVRFGCFEKRAEEVFL